MTFPRFTAAVFVLLLLGSLSFVVVFAVNWIGPTMAHGTNVMHRNGKIVQIVGPDRNFVLKTPEGQMLSFQCGQNCRASLGHMQRHLIEKANTDIYFIQGADNTLQAIDVD